MPVPPVLSRSTGRGRAGPPQHPGSQDDPPREVLRRPVADSSGWADSAPDRSGGPLRGAAPGAPVRPGLLQRAAAAPPGVVLGAAGTALLVLWGVSALLAGTLASLLVLGVGLVVLGVASVLATRGSRLPRDARRLTAIVIGAGAVLAAVSAVQLTVGLAAVGRMLPTSRAFTSSGLSATGTTTAGSPSPLATASPVQAGAASTAGVGGAAGSGSAVAPLSLLLAQATTSSHRGSTGVALGALLGLPSAASSGAGGAVPGASTVPSPAESLFGVTSPAVPVPGASTTGASTPDGGSSSAPAGTASAAPPASPAPLPTNSAPAVPPVVTDPTTTDPQPTDSAPAPTDPPTPSASDPGTDAPVPPAATTVSLSTPSAITPVTDPVVPSP